MSLAIRVADPHAPIPRRTLLELRCDAHQVAPVIFDEGGFVENHAAAMRAGWLERQTSNGRIWLCPRCSNKAART